MRVNQKLPNGMTLVVQQSSNGHALRLYDAPAHAAPDRAYARILSSHDIVDMAQALAGYVRENRLGTV